MVEMEEAIDKVAMGPERRSKRMSAKDKELTAYHEAGHALVAKLLPNADLRIKYPSLPAVWPAAIPECSPKIGRIGLNPD